MKLLVAGASGMLGSDVMRAGERAGHELVGLSHQELDVADAAAVQRAFAGVSPDAAVNCAAWTDVDGAESHREQARAVNAEGAGNIARAAASAGVPLVYVSTDYVFAGDAPLDAAGSPRPYVESDPTGPRSVYGETKLEGELQVLAASPRHAVVRSSWLFGVDGHNFVATMLRLGGEGVDGGEGEGVDGAEDGAEGGGEGEGRDGGAGERGGGEAGGADRVTPSVQVVTDQVGCPTWTGHLAPALLGLIEREVSGLAHLAGTGQVSWNGFAREIFRQAEIKCVVEPATSEQMARPAPRPAWSALASERADVLPMPDWRDGLAGYLAARAGMMRA
jgi:dTDP-4-dehydrorhamnose reductase